MSATPFADLNALATHLRQELENKKFILLYAYNGTGKTRLSTAFKDISAKRSRETCATRSTSTPSPKICSLGITTSTNDRERVLKINRDLDFFAGLGEMEMDNRIRPLLNRYADFDFKIDTDEWEVSFSREVTIGDGKLGNSGRHQDFPGEENIFIWCFFLAIVQLDARRCRGLQVGEIHLHRRPDFLAG